MQTEPIIPTFLSDAKGNRTHAIISYEDWELLSARPAQPDDFDLLTIARLEREMAETPEEFEEAPVTNPIRKARLSAGIRQGDLASALGITQPALSKLEREGHQARTTTTVRVMLAIKKMKKLP